METQDTRSIPELISVHSGPAERLLGMNGRFWTTQDLLQQMEYTAGFLNSRGLGKNDAVAVTLTRDRSWFVKNWSERAVAAVRAESATSFHHRA